MPCRDDGVLRSSAGEVRLSQQHAEILTVFADRPEGLSATELADAVYGRDDAVVTLRAPHRIALAAYAGPVLPASESPGTAHLRETVRAQLRESLLAGASIDTLLAFARTSDGADDVEVWLACLRLLPPRSPRRSAVVARLEELDAALTTGTGRMRREDPDRTRRAWSGSAGQPRRLRG